MLAVTTPPEADAPPVSPFQLQSRVLQRLWEEHLLQDGALQGWLGV